MPLRREREAYWDDISRHISEVDPLTGSGALARLCPDAAAARDALKSRLISVDDEMARLERHRARALAEARVVEAEDAARDRLAAKAARQAHAAAFVRGRMENDRREGVRAHFGEAHRAPRAQGAPRMHGAGAGGVDPNHQRRVVPFSAPDNDARRCANREVNERWGSAEMYSPLMVRVGEGGKEGASHCDRTSSRPLLT